MNRRHALGTALGGILAAVAGMKADARESAEPTITLTGPLAGGLTFTSGVSGETPYIPRADIGPQAWERMDADGIIHGPDYERRMVVRTGAADGYYTMAAWVPGLVERLPRDFTTSDAAIDGNHFAVRFAQPVVNMRRVVLLDGVRQPKAREAYTGAHGWVIRNHAHPESGGSHLDPTLTYVVRERVFGKVEILPWDGV